MNYTKITPLYLMMVTFLFYFTSIATSQATEVDDFLSKDDIVDIKLSPNGKYLALIWNQGNSRIIMIRDLTQEGFPAIKKISDNINRAYSLTWASNKHLLFGIHLPVALSKYKEELNTPEFNPDDFTHVKRTMSIDIETGSMIQLFNGKRLLRRNKSLSMIESLLPNEPEFILISAHASIRNNFATKSGINFLYKVNLITGKATRFAEGDEYTIRFLADDTGRLRYRVDYHPISRKLKIYKYNQSEEDWSKFIEYNTEENSQEKYFNDIFTLGLYDNGFANVRYNNNSGFKELFLFSGKSGLFQSHIKKKNENILFPLKKRLSESIIGYVYTDKGLHKNYYFNKERQEKVSALEKQLGDTSFSIISTSSDGLKSIILTRAANDTGTYYLYDNKKDRFTFIGNKNNKIRPEVLALPANLKYNTRDKLNIEAYALIPQHFNNKKPLPLVVLPHGGPTSRDYPYYNELAQFIATRGFIVIQPNFRGSRGYGLNFEALGYKEWGKKMLNDLEDSVDFMVRKKLADPNKVCIVGGSYGGYAALMSIVKKPEMYKCAISINGISDLIDMLNYDADRFGDDSLTIKKLYQLVGHIKKDKAQLKAQSPLFGIDEIQAGVLLIAGENDKIVEVSQSKKMHNALQKANKYVELIAFEEEGHGIKKIDNKKKMYKRIEIFLQKYLSPLPE